MHFIFTTSGQFASSLSLTNTCWDSKLFSFYTFSTYCKSASSLFPPPACASSYGSSPLSFSLALSPSESRTLALSHSLSLSYDCFTFSLPFFTTHTFICMRQLTSLTATHHLPIRRVIQNTKVTHMNPLFCSPSKSLIKWTALFIRVYCAMKKSSRVVQINKWLECTLEDAHLKRESRWKSKANDSSSDLHTEKHSLHFYVRQRDTCKMR